MINYARRQTGRAVNRLLRRLLRLTNRHQHPSGNALWVLCRDIEVIKLDIKNFGYDLARTLSDINHLGKNVPDSAPIIQLQSKATTQADMESSWLAYWCRELQIKPIYHRQIWEFCYVLQALHEHIDDFESGGRKGIGFGCGEEPLPSLLASYGHEITVTDLEPEKVKGMGWAETEQHTASIEKAFHDELVDRAAFDKCVTLRYVDMNAIDADLAECYDFCWSVCAYEHLGSIEKGLTFVEESLLTLRSGGIAVHTTEFNYLYDDETVDNWITVLFQRKHFQRIAKRLTVRGHYVAPLNFDLGSGPIDKFIDLPPYAYEGGWRSRERAVVDGACAHLRLSVDGFPSTCFGLIIKKR